MNYDFELLLKTPLAFLCLSAPVQSRIRCSGRSRRGGDAGKNVLPQHFPDGCLRLTGKESFPGRLRARTNRIVCRNLHNYCIWYRRGSNRHAFIIGSLFKIASCCNLKCFDQRVTTLLQGMAIFRCFISVQLQVIESEKCRCFHQLFEGSVDNTDLF